MESDGRATRPGERRVSPARPPLLRTSQRYSPRLPRARPHPFPPATRAACCRDGACRVRAGAERGGELVRLDEQPPEQHDPVPPVEAGSRPVPSAAVR